MDRTLCPGSRPLAEDPGLDKSGLIQSLDGADSCWTPSLGLPRAGSLASLRGALENRTSSEQHWGTTHGIGDTSATEGATWTDRARFLQQRDPIPFACRELLSWELIPACTWYFSTSAQP